MTPKEKAFELVDKYMNLGMVKMSDYSVIYLPTAKQCTLIAINELLEHLQKSNDVANIHYWQQVKNEIYDL